MDNLSIWGIFNTINTFFNADVLYFCFFIVYVVFFALYIIFPGMKGRYLYIVAEILTVITILKVIIQFILRL